MKSLCEKHCAVVRRLALGGELFGVKAETVVKMLEDTDMSARLSGQLDLIERILAGSSVHELFATVKADAEREFAKFRESLS